MEYPTAPDVVRLDTAAQQSESGWPGPRHVIAGLFPEPPVPARRALSRRLLGVIAQVLAVGVGAAALLERVPGIPSWDTIYAEDYWKFLTQALQRPWQVYIPFGGYEELLPRVMAQFALYLPLIDASRWFAVCGALVGAGSALFIFHASAGHVRSPLLRAVLGTAVVLLPIAPMELVDSGVGAPWYLMLATFWALLWRPRTRAGMAVAALVAFAAVASEVTIVLFLPLVAARLFVLRRPREHAVTAGWLAGCLVQVPAVVYSYVTHQSRLNTGLGSLSQSLAFYAHVCLLPAFGWHVAWRLQSFAGRNGATVLAAAALVIILGAIFVVQRENRLFVVTAVVTGLVFCVISITLSSYLVARTVKITNEPGSRYSMLPIFLFECAVIVGVDYVMRQRGGLHRLRGLRARPALAVLALVAVLAASWVADFRFSGYRTWGATDWAPVVATWQHACEESRSGLIVEKAGASFQTLPCDRMRFSQQSRTGS